MKSLLCKHVAAAVVLWSLWCASGLKPQTPRTSAGNFNGAGMNGNVTIMPQCMMYKYMRLDDGTRTCTLLTLFFSPPAKKCREV